MRYLTPLRPAALIVLCGLIAFPLFSQVKKGRKHVKAKAYDKAAAAFEKHLSHAKWGAAAHLEMGGLLTLEETFSLPAIQSALSYVRAADSIYQSLPARKQRKQRKLGVSPNTLRRAQSDMVKMALNALKEQSEILAYDQFMDEVPPLSRFNQRRAESVRSFIVNAEMERLNSLSYEVLTALVNRHGDLLRKNHLGFENRIKGQLLRSFLKAYELGDLKKMAEDHPSHWIAAECHLDAFVEAARAPGIEPLLDFLNDYPLSMINDFASNAVASQLSGIDQSSLTEAQAARLQEVRGFTKVNNQMRWGIAPRDIDELIEVINRGAPAQRTYVLMQRVVEQLRRDKEWASAIRLIRACGPQFPDERPPGCQANFVYYSTKERWVKDATAILSRPADSLHLYPIEELNTGRNERSPVIDVSGEVLYYSSPDAEMGTEILESTYDYESEKWQQPKVVASLSTEQNEAPLSITADGNTMLLFRNGKLFTSRRTLEGWSPADSLKSEVNAFPWLGRAVLSPDGNALIFAASKEALENLYRPSDIDIFVALRQKDGQFGHPFPIGPAINTDEQERSPFLHADGKTFYFSSSGHGGLGETDVFMCRRLDDTWRNWTEPVNLGKEINSIYHDWGYNLSLSPSGGIGYLSSDDLGWSYHSDLYATGIPEAARPQRQKTVIGAVTSEYPITSDTKIVIRDAKSNAVIAEVAAQPNGRFQYVLPDSVAQVKFEVNRPGIFPKSTVAELPAGKEVVRLNDTMNVVTLKAMVQEGKAAPIEVYFPTNGAQLDSASYFNLQQLFELVKDRTWVLEISGHTDQEGAEPYNLRLSKERAESVSSYLRKLGLPDQRLRPVGKGSGMPVAKNDTEAGRAKNRRVEIRLLLPADED